MVGACGAEQRRSTPHMRCSWQLRAHRQLQQPVAWPPLRGTRRTHTVQPAAWRGAQCCCSGCPPDLAPCSGCPPDPPHPLPPTPCCPPLPPLLPPDLPALLPPSSPLQARSSLTMVVSNSTFKQNFVMMGGFGGGVYGRFGGLARVETTLFEGNQAGSGGSACWPAAACTRAGVAWECLPRCWGPGAVSRQAGFRWWWAVALP
jgi:hypothetical protein